MKKVFTRLVALALAASVVLSLFVAPSSAADVYRDTFSVNQWNTTLSVLGTTLDACFVRAGDSELVGQVTYEQLMSLVGAYNAQSMYGGFIDGVRLYGSELSQDAFTSFMQQVFHGKPQFDVKPDDMCNGVMRIYEMNTNRWVVRSDGSFPYCSPSDYNAGASGIVSGLEDGNVPAYDGPANPYRAKWVESEKALFKPLVITTKTVLAQAAYDLNRGALVKATLGADSFFVLYDSVNDEFRCDSTNHVYAAPVEPDKAAVNNTTVNNYISGEVTNVEGDNIVLPDVDVEISPSLDYSTLVEIDEMVFHPLEVNGDNVIIGDNGQIIDSLTYNPDNRTYTVNTYDYTYNTTNNFYEYNYYTYNVQYTYNNTYVTYIGSTAEFQPTEYKLYYKLPDGRSSADLTEEDVAGLSFQFADVVNYKRAVTDESLLALYHFDGDTEDDSYYSYPLPRNNTSWKALPEGYTQLEYIETTGAQYIEIDTPMVSSASSFDLDFQVLGDDSRNLFRIDARSNSQWMFSLSASLDHVYFSANDSHSMQNFSYSSGRRHFIFDFAKGTYSIAGNTGSLIGNRSSSGWLDAPFYLFSDDWGLNRVTGRFYSLKISTSSSIDHYFIPCISPSGEVGIYDNAYYLEHGYYPTNPDSYFYGNSDSDEFIAGPAVKSQLQFSGIDYQRFVWKKGASISYMESNAFNGALYLDETEHEFNINLPKTLGRSFSIYFRYYQNSSKDTNHVDNYISSNGNKLLSWSEQYMYAPDGHQLTTPLSVGSWQEIALFRDGHYLYIYHNGIKVESVDVYDGLSSVLSFHFGADSRAYSMLDEIRVLDFPRTTWKSYTPTVVPMDTNEVLVLPGTKVQVSGLDTYYHYSVQDRMNVYSLFDGYNWVEDGYDETYFQFNNHVCYDEENDYYAWGRSDGVEVSDILESNIGVGHGPFDDYTFTYSPIIAMAGNSYQGIGSSAEGVVSPSSVVQNVALLSTGDFYLTNPSAAPVYLFGVKMNRRKTKESFGKSFYDF